jgi:hypothetical protein
MSLAANIFAKKDRKLASKLSQIANKSVNLDLM